MRRFTALVTTRDKRRRQAGVELLLERWEVNRLRAEQELRTGKTAPTSFADFDMERLRKLARGTWGTDVQSYINKLRAEWHVR